MIFCGYINKMIIGLFGRANSGKTTLAEYITTHYNFEELSFASALKDYVSITYDLPRDLVEGRTSESRKWREEFKVNDLTIRDLLVSVAETKKKIDPNYWINIVKEQIDPNKNYVISDCRFSNEIDFIKSFPHSATINIRNKFNTYLCDDEYIDHLDTDYIFINEKDKQHKIKELIDEILSKN